MMIMKKVLRLREGWRIYSLTTDYKVIAPRGSTCHLILEAIFLGEDLSLKSIDLKKRIANLLAKNQSEFYKIVKLFNNIYDLRNAIIHGHSDWREKEYLKLLKKVYLKNIKNVKEEDIINNPLMDK